jgi:hypothetical protein
VNLYMYDSLISAVILLNQLFDRGWRLRVLVHSVLFVVHGSVNWSTTTYLLHLACFCNLARFVAGYTCV